MSLFVITAYITMAVAVAAPVAVALMFKRIADRSGSRGPILRSATQDRGSAQNDHKQSRKRSPISISPTPPTITIDALDTDIFDCDLLAFGKHVGLDKRYRIETLRHGIRDRDDLWLIGSARRHLIQAEGFQNHLHNYKIKAAILPRESYSPADSIFASSTDVYVMSTFVGAGLLIESNDARSINGNLGGDSLGRYQALRQFVRQKTGQNDRIVVNTYDEAAKAFARNVLDRIIVNSNLRSFRDEPNAAALARNLGSHDAGGYRISVTTGPVLAISDPKSVVLTFRDCEHLADIARAAHTWRARGPTLVAQNYADDFSNFSPEDAAVHATLCLNIPTHYLFHLGVPVPRELRTKAMEIVGRVFCYAAELTAYVHEHLGEYAKFLVQEHQKLKGNSSLLSHPDLSIEFTESNVERAIEQSYRFTLPDEYFLDETTRKYYWHTKYPDGSFTLTRAKSIFEIIENRCYSAICSQSDQPMQKIHQLLDEFGEGYSEASMLMGRMVAAQSPDKPLP